MVSLSALVLLPIGYLLFDQAFDTGFYVSLFMLTIVALPQVIEAIDYKKARKNHRDADHRGADL